MRVAFISDIHSNIEAFLTILNFLEKKKVDQIYVAGDILGYYYNAVEVVDVCMNRENIFCIRGNHDRDFLTAMSNETVMESFTKKYGSSFKKAQDELKSRLNKNVEKQNATQKNLQEEEKKLIQQKKLLSQDEYKKKVDELRIKVSNLQKNRGENLQKIAKQRAKAKQELLDNLNPILKKYMAEKQIRMVIDKKNLILADERLDITSDIMKLLNAKIKSVKLD